MFNIFVLKGTILALDCAGAYLIYAVDRITLMRMRSTVQNMPKWY